HLIHLLQQAHLVLQQQGSNAPSSSKTAALASQSMAWTTSDTRYESVGVSRAQELSPIDSLMHEDSIPDEQVHLSDDEDFGNDHLPKADSQKDWWKPLPKEERPATLELSWIIPSSNVSYVENNWASALVSTSKTAAENSLLAKTRDMTTFMKCKGSSPALSISKMKATRYPNFGLELLVSEQMWIDDVCTYDITDFQEHTIAEKDSKNLYSSDFEDLNLLLLQDHLDYLPGLDKRMLSTDVKLWTQNLFSDGTLTRVLEALDYRVKEFKVMRLNPGMNTRFWTQKDVTMSKEFIADIEKRPKTRRIYWNLECFVGGRVRDIDYRLLQRTE
ncbi:hypothetical protein Tco_1136952, partial [Tanacetum coccineum]